PESSARSRDEKHRVTVWFNAWKYQSTEQVWAGLADCILHEVTDRMPVRERQRFWLQLQLSRPDTEEIQRRILEKVLSEWWKIARPWVWATIGLILLFVVSASLSKWPSWMPIPFSSHRFGIGGMLISAVLGGFQQFYLYTKSKTEVEKEP